METEAVQGLFGDLTALGWSTGVLLVLAVVIWFVHGGLMRVFNSRPGQQHYRQLLMACVYLFAANLAIILLPFSDATQEKLLGFLLLLTGATLALSGTTVVGNAMAGLMLRSTRRCRPGDYIKAGEYFGRVRNMDLLHVEILTENRGVTLLPNLFLVTNPLHVLQASGAAVSADVSLALIVPRATVEDALLAAATAAGLERPVVAIVSLDDAVVRYQVSGQVDRIERFIAARRELHASVLDALQSAGIATTAAVAASAPVTVAVAPVAADVPPVQPVHEPRPAAATAAAVVLDQPKVDELKALKKDYTAMSQQLIEIEQELRDAGQGDERQPISLKKKKLEAQMLRVEKEIGKLAAGLKAT